jgi:hypothetical protein
VVYRRTPERNNPGVIPSLTFCFCFAYDSGAHQPDAPGIAVKRDR